MKASIGSILLIFLSMGSSAIPCALGRSRDDQPSPYIERFSKSPWQKYPGGQYKASTNATLTASTIAGALFKLNPGGLRELHWHNVDEWAFVIEGSCRAAVLDESKTAPADMWDFGPGDVWYFPENTAHAILGLSPKGCTYVTGYNSPSFEERSKSFSSSGWFASLSPEVLAQGLGISLEAAKQLKAVNKGEPSFLPLATGKTVFDQQPSIQQQFPRLIHRFPSMQNTHAVVHGDGSYVNKVDVGVFPVSKNMLGALVRIAPGGMRQLHWHLNIDEWQYVINGTLEAGIFLKPKDSTTGVLYPGDLGFAPKGSAHYLKNVGKDWAHVVLIFNQGEFTDIEVSNFLGAFPPSWVAASLNISEEAAGQIDYQKAGFAPALTPSPSQSAATESLDF